MCHDSFTKSTKEVFKSAWSMAFSKHVTQDDSQSMIGRGAVVELHAEWLNG
jgi:hypothetical protein